MQLGFNLWAWTWCNISRPRKSGTLGGGTGGTCGARCPGTFAFLEPKEFLEPVEPVKRMGFHGFQVFLGFKHAWFHRFHTRSTLVPHGFNQATGSTGSRQVQPRYGSPHSTQLPWVQPSILVPQVPDRFLGFNRGTVGIVEGVNFGNCPNYVALNAPLRRTIFGMGGDVFLTGMPFTNRNHATGSTGFRQVPWVQPRHWFHSFQTGSLGSNTQWFHRFHTGFLGSTRH